MSIVTPVSRHVNLGLTVLRIIAGIIFAAHGGQKLFVWGFAGVTTGFGHMGVPLPGITGPFVGVVEFFGGIALILGLLTRLAGLALAIDMLCAIFLVKLHGGLFSPRGMELELMLFGAAAALALIGGGTLSIDGLLAGRRAT